MKEVCVCEAMKSPVGTLSNGTVLRQQDGGTKSRQVPIHNVRVRSIRPCSFPLKWRYGLTNFPIGTPRPQTNVSASLHCFVLDSASWDIAPVSRLNMCVLWKSWIAINRNERRNVNARSRNRYFQVKKCSSHLKPRRINAHKSF